MDNNKIKIIIKLIKEFKDNSNHKNKKFSVKISFNKIKTQLYLVDNKPRSQTVFLETKLLIKKILYFSLNQTLNQTHLLEHEAKISL